MQVVAIFNTSEDLLTKVNLTTLVGKTVAISSKRIGQNRAELDLRIDVNAKMLSYGDMTELGGMMMGIAAKCQNILNQTKSMNSLCKDLTGTLKTIQDGADKEEKVGPASDCESTASETC